MKLSRVFAGMVSVMFGGIAVAGNLLCISYSDVRGKVFLVDVEDRRLASQWEYGGEAQSYADAGGVAMDSSYNIFVADTHNDMVRRYNPFGKALAQLGQEPDGAPGAARRDRIGVLNRPRATAVYGDVVYVACGDRKLRRGVQCFHRDGRVMKPLLPFGETEGRWGAPQGISASAKGVFVADTLHAAVQRFRSYGMYVSQFSTALRHDEASRPIAVQPLVDGDLLVLDDGDEPGLRRFAIGGEFKPLDVDLGFDDAVDIAVDEQHRVYVLDRNGVRVQRLHPDLSFDCTIVDLTEIAFG